MNDTPDATPEETPGHGVVIRARNGDVIRYDPSGLVMRLSDKVVADIAVRLPGLLPSSGGSSGPARGALDMADDDDEDSSGTVIGRADPEVVLAGIDAWDVRQEGRWLRFSARVPGLQGVRGFRKSVAGGDVIADSAGPLLGILGLGGQKAALANSGKSDFPPHIVAPADDIGAVGHAGVEKAKPTDRLEHLREMTHEALVAETLLHWRMERYEPLPLFWLFRVLCG